MTESDMAEEKKEEAGDQEKGGASSQGSLPKAEFSLLVSSLASQAMISLGVAENPLTDKIEKDLQQARFTIDLLDVLQEKTQGNLDENESKLLESVLYHLHVEFIEASKK